MIENDLTFKKETPTGAPRTSLIATMKGGHTPPPPTTQSEAATSGVRLGTHLDSLTSIRPVHSRGPRKRSKGTTTDTEGPTVVRPTTHIAVCAPCNTATIQPATPPGQVESEPVLKGEPIRDDAGQDNTSPPPCNYGSVASGPTRTAFDRLSDLVKLILIPTRIKNRQGLKRRCDQHKLA
jgi:hypothetical protein